MKVLDEIVRYLSARGALFAEEIDSLEALGFVSNPESDPDGLGDIEPDDEAAPPTLPAPRRRGKRKNHKALRAPVLAGRLRDALREAERHVRALACVSPVPTGSRWDRIEGLARAPKSDVVTAMSAALDDGTASFRAIWDAIAYDGILGVLGPEERGPAASAFRALAALRSHRDLGRYVWILRKRPVARAYDWLRAQTIVTQAMGACHERAPQTLGKWLSREPHVVAYWSFVLVYNARKWAAQGRLALVSGEQPARRKMPQTSDLARAWANALLLGGPEAAKFLAAFWRAHKIGEALWRALPEGAPPEVSEHWLAAALTANNALREGIGPPLLTAIRALGELDFGPSEQLIEEGVSGAPSSAAAPSFRRPIPSQFLVQLTCPSGWNA